MLFRWLIKFLIILAIVLFAKFSYAQSTNQNKAVDKNNDHSTMDYVIGGGVGASLLEGGRMLYKKVSHSSSNQELSEAYGDYKSSPAYVRDQVEVLQKEHEKTKQQIERLFRRYFYIDKNLDKSLNGYVSYEDKRPSKQTHS
ncbi:hypothetical protein [Crocosphaera sp. Alani8]|uniref:hypothetical protein n=1 Tax=Crocosphaera sp. Alani8 TaxID=3038952 RepID=UPI00313DB7BA